MKKYIKIDRDMVYQTDEINKDDLIRVQNGVYDTIVNTHDGTKFNVSENKWEEIPTT